MTNDPLNDEIIRGALQEYHCPPEPPREEMWSAISAARRAPERAPRRVPGRVLWAAAIAASFLIGVQVGEHRFTSPDVRSPEASRGQAGTMDPVVRDHLARSALLLAAFRVDATAGTVSATTVDGARELLVQNRILHGDPLLGGTEIEQLLEDVELVLVQIAALTGDPLPAEIDFVEDALESQRIFPRLSVMVRASGLGFGG